MAGHGFITKMITPFTEDQWHFLDGMVNSTPCELKDAVLFNAYGDLDDFVYDRKYGYMRVPSGHHQMVMCLLLAYHHGFEYYTDVMRKFKIKKEDDLAEKWLELEGTCFKSSVSTIMKAGYKGNLNASEKIKFKNCRINYILED